MEYLEINLSEIGKRLKIEYIVSYLSFCLNLLEKEQIIKYIKQAEKKDLNFSLKICNKEISSLEKELDKINSKLDSKLYHIVSHIFPFFLRKSKNKKSILKERLEILIKYKSEIEKKLEEELKLDGEIYIAIGGSLEILLYGIINGIGLEKTKEWLEKRSVYGKPKVDKNPRIAFTNGNWITESILYNLESQKSPFGDVDLIIYLKKDLFHVLNDKSETTKLKFILVEELKKYFEKSQDKSKLPSLEIRIRKFSKSMTQIPIVISKKTYYLYLDRDVEKLIDQKIELLTKHVEEPSDMKWISDLVYLKEIRPEYVINKINENKEEIIKSIKKVYASLDNEAKSILKRDLKELEIEFT